MAKKPNRYESSKSDKREDRRGSFKSSTGGAKPSAKPQMPMRKMNRRGK